MGVLNPGGWPSRAWPDNHWAEDSWPEYGTVAPPAPPAILGGFQRHATKLVITADGQPLLDLNNLMISLDGQVFLNHNGIYTSPDGRILLNLNRNKPVYMIIN